MNQEEALSQLGEIVADESHLISQFLSRAAAEIDLERPFHGIEICRNEQVRVDGKFERQDRVHIHWPRKPKFGSKTPLLLIDADADLEINRVFFGATLTSAKIPAKRCARVIQCSSTRLSRHTLLRKNPPESSRIEPSLRDVISVIEKEASTGERIFVVATKKVAEVLRAKQIQNIEIAHFGAIRGLDEWRDCDTVIVIGREEP